MFGLGIIEGISRPAIATIWPTLKGQTVVLDVGANVSATEGNKGRVFYSYVNRHLDVLVDHDGKVISLGLY